jgi:small ligand-binding sensory domain FIST
VAFAGGAAVGILANGTEVLDAPALAVMLADLPPGDFQVFSGARPLPAGQAHSALVHADPAAPDLADLIDELSQRTAAGYLFGGLVSSRARAVQWAQGAVTGGLSGVGFAAGVALISRVTQGCQPVGPVRQVTEAERNLVLSLDGGPALPALLADLSLDLADPRQSLPVLRATLVGLTDAGDDMLARAGQFGADVRVRHLIGLDPSRDAVAVAELLEPGTQLAFCRRDMAAARRDLVRICTEIRDEVESTDDAGSASPAAARRRIAGALYISCAGRGGPHFGGPSAEAQIVRHALGDVPLAGFFAGGEVARHHLYGYTGVLTVFCGS